MERKLDRKTLSFGKGITNVPSDLLSDDTELAESNGFIYRNGEMKPVQEAKMVGNIPYKIVYVHKGADYRHLIAVQHLGEMGGSDDYSNIYFYAYENGSFVEKQCFTIPKIKSVTSSGNTIICSTIYGLYRFLRKDGEYKSLSGEIPKIDIDFSLEQFDNLDDKERTKLILKDFIFQGESTAWYDSDGNFISAGDKPEGGVNGDTFYVFNTIPSDSDKMGHFKDAIQGHVAQAINWVKSKNVFAFPFFVRFGLRLFDGSIANISKPILLFPSVDRNCKIRKGVYLSTGDGYPKYVENKVDETCEFYYFIQYSELLLRIRNISQLKDWEDIVKGIVIFASDQVIPFYTDRNWEFKDAEKVASNTFFNTVSLNTYQESRYTFKYHTRGDGIMEAYKPLLPEYKTSEEIRKSLLDKSIFYKILEIDVKDAYAYEDGDYHHTIDRPDMSKSYYKNTKILKIADHTIEVLTSLEQMKDDYFGWCSFVPDGVFPYNNRLNLFGVNRMIDNNISYADLYYGGTSVDIYVYMSSSYRTGWIKVGRGTLPNKLLNNFFFFFHPDAKRIVFFNKDKGYISKPLTTHPRLNGSYVFDKLPSEAYPEFTKGTLEEIGIDAKEYSEYFDSQIFTSVVNNPFVFEASGDNTVGTGRILGIIANTEAVSQGQFGQYPLMVFTNEGIYGMGVNSEGLYSNAYPISRDVCLDDSPLVPTDNFVLFVSKKGLMAASGGTVTCLSNQLRGRISKNFDNIEQDGFLNYLKECFIAYDYRDSLFRIIGKGKTYQYVYDMEGKTFTMAKLDAEIQAVVNDYPDNLIQDISGYVYSLTGKPDINDDEKKYSGSFTTRPLKLGGSMTLKSLRAIKHLYDTDEGKVKLEVYASNDCKNWVKLTSLGGKPWKYFTFKYTLTDFRACDSFAGTIVEVQSRREDKMR